MIKLVLKRVDNKGFITFSPPADPALREKLKKELLKCRDKFGDFCQVTIEPPKKQRSTGIFSQNHHLNGHIMQICGATGNDYDTIKYCVKMKAIEAYGYPFETVCGQIIPKPEHECDTTECAKLIEAAHILAAEEGIFLQE